MYWFLLIGLIGSVLLLYVTLGFFIYADARKRSEESPALWTALALLVPNLMGLLIYFLVGRKKKSDGSKNKFKMLLMAAAMGAVLFSGSFIGYVVLSNDLPVVANTSIGMVSSNWGNKWTVSFKTSGATLHKAANLKEEDMEKVWVESSCEEGFLYLLLIQDDRSEVINITDFTGYLDLSTYEPGKIKMQFFNEKARNAKFQLSW